MSQSRAVAACVCALGILTLGFTGRASRDPTASQIAAGMLSNWKDGETWSRYLDLSDQTELGLGLIPAGKGGSGLLSFAAKWPRRTVSGPPQAILVFSGIAANTDANLRRTPTLVFSLDAGTSRPTLLDWTSRLVVDRIGPGGQPTSGVATIAPADFTRVARANTLAATLFGIEVEFTPAQRQAIRTFAQKIAIP